MIRAMMGHTTQRMTERYAGVRPETKRAAVERISIPMTSGVGHGESSQTAGTNSAQQEALSAKTRKCYTSQPTDYTTREFSFVILVTCSAHDWLRTNDFFRVKALKK